MIDYSKLPQGWFNKSDILFYESVLSKLYQGAKIIEIGSWKGRSLCALSDLIKHFKLEVSSVDTWKGSESENHEGGPHYEANLIDIFEVFKNNIDKYGITSFVTPYRMTSTEASKLFENNTFDFIFIDADHKYSSVIEDMRNWFPKLKSNGTFAGHDWRNNNGVVRATDEFFESRDNYNVDNIIWWKKYYE